MIVRYNNIEIDLEQFRITNAGQEVTVEPKVFDTIAYLVKNQSRMVTRDELFETVWEGRQVSDATLSNHIKNARKALDDDGERQQVIKTVRGRGYQFIAQLSGVQEEDKQEVAPSSEPLTTAHTRPLRILAFIATALLVGSITFWQWPSPQKSEKPYIIVLPFSVSSNNSETWAPFADQITRELIQHLRKIAGTRVVPPPSAFTFKDNKTRGFIRNQLPEVNYVLDGVVSEASTGGIRISVELENLLTGSLVWDKDFDINVSDANVFTVQSSIAESVSDALKVSILSKVQRQLAQAPTTSIEAYELYINGQYQFSLLSHESVQQAIELFDQAIALDPLFEEALVARSNAYRILMNVFEIPKDVLPKVISASIDVLDVNPQSAYARSSLGVAYVHAWLWNDAWKMLSEARKRDPDLALTELGFSLYYSAIGDFSALHKSVQRASELDPLNPEIAEWGMWALMMANELEAASDWGKKMYALHPKNPYMVLSLAVNETMKGNYEAGIKWAEQGVNMSNRIPFSLIILAQAYAAAGTTAQIPALIAEAEAANEYMCPYETAVIYSLLGQPDIAFGLLNEAVAYRSNCLMFTRHDPRLQPLRNDPRYDHLLERLNLTDEDILSYSK
ncbi:winged helix-turn-helix domain-containing protein [Gilvimarinus sp. SDUM040013]|uniref:Winged helix-turn-helix domain-containing protein n=1 Tax=Gilvimarinus gilvus TaxID=3058038 RepID=A0ABU4RTU8_9GAMM|nr:winged helix-turn-helix domain-containing protein [Gilvimarinus sp. SDUM040013]MDO3386761.1 winged helix-turn-helix domain-containing protein [Gilvimarinus sp. SDUM040013]MDX6848309.1 winged helix-turn-helix domain-containing protein [Gilvimarinus sp. SDUM040013]